MSLLRRSRPCLQPENRGSVCKRPFVFFPMAMKTWPTVGKPPIPSRHGLLRLHPIVTRDGCDFRTGCPTDGLSSCRWMRCRYGTCPSPWRPLEKTGVHWLCTTSGLTFITTPPTSITGVSNSVTSILQKRPLQLACSLPSTREKWISKRPTPKPWMPGLRTRCVRRTFWSLFSVRDGRT